MIKKYFWKYCVFLLTTYSAAMAMEARNDTRLPYLPEEIVLQVFSHLTPKELCQAGAVCREWHILARDKELWEDRLVKMDTSVWDSAALQNPLRTLANFINAYPIKRLHFSHLTMDSQFNKAFVELINARTNLAHLAVERFSLGGEAAIPFTALLQEHPTITSWAFDTCLMGNSGVRLVAQAAKENTLIASLSLRTNIITSTGAWYLANMIKEHETLLELDLENNRIDSNGLKYLIDALRSNKKLRSLNLRRNEVNYEGFYYVAEHLQENQSLMSLYIGGNYLSSEIKELLVKKYGSRIITNFSQ